MFPRILFPDRSITLAIENQRTLVPSSLQGISNGDSSLASQGIPSWNRIVAWLRDLDRFRKIAV